MLQFTWFYDVIVWCYDQIESNVWMKWQHLQNSYGVSSKHLDQTNVVINKSHKEKLISSTTTTTYNNKLQPISLLKRFQSLKWYRIKRIQFNKIRIVCNDGIILLFHIQCESIEYTAGAWQCQTIVCNRCRKKQNRQCDRSIYAWKWSFANFFFYFRIVHKLCAVLSSRTS